jgi:tetratricopeptide (TPR) repeat protein
MQRSGMADGAGAPRGSIADLELRFAQQPESDAFIPLCEAYLEQGRLMEAMIVCRKGLKTLPDSESAQLLLARILIAQKKLPRALTELDKAVGAHPSSSAARSLRGSVRIDAGRDAEGVEDLQEALRLDPDDARARTILTERGLLAAPIPEPPVSPVVADPVPPSAAPVPPSGPPVPPSGPPVPPSRDPAPLPAAGPPSAAPSSDPSSTASPAAPAAPPSGPAPASTVAPAATAAGRRVAPQVLEGEEELESLARSVAEERPRAGRPLLTLGLAGVLLVLTAGIVTWRVLEKQRLEGIDRLTQRAVASFRQDSYVGYREASAALEDILEDYDGDHPPTLGRLAHTLAILWGEHGDTGLQPRLRAVLTEAKEEADDVAHTWAAAGLVALYEAPDQGAGGEAAMDVLAPFIRTNQEAGRVSPPVQLVQGIAAIHRGSYESAFDALEQARQSVGLELRATVWAAVAAWRSGRLGTAQNLLDQALRLDPQHPGALAYLSLVKLQRGNLKGASKALLTFQEVEKSRPKDISPKSRALAQYARSELYRSAGEEERAAIAYEEATTLDPRNPDFPYSLGRSLLKLQRPKEAIAPLEKALALEPNRYAILVDLAEAEMYQRRFERAQAHIDAALAKNPDYLPAQLAKARLLRRTGAEGTRDYLEQLLANRPAAFVEVKLELGRLYRQQDRLDDAQRALEEAAEKMGARSRPLQADVLLSYGRLMEDRGDLGVAQTSYAKAAEFEELEGWYRLSVAAAKAGDTVRAKKACTRYLEAGEGLRYSRNARRICDQL